MRRKIVRGVASVLGAAALLAMTGCGVVGDLLEVEVAGNPVACKDKLRQDLREAIASPTPPEPVKSRPSECVGVGDQDLEVIVEELMAESFEDAFQDAFEGQETGQ